MSKTATTTTTAQSLAQRFVSAKGKGKTAIQSAITRYVNKRAAEGYNPTQVRAGVKSWITRLSK